MGGWGRGEIHKPARGAEGTAWRAENILSSKKWGARAEPNGTTGTA